MLCFCLVNSFLYYLLVSTLCTIHMVWHFVKLLKDNVSAWKKQATHCFTTLLYHIYLRVRRLFRYYTQNTICAIRDFQYNCKLTELCTPKIYWTAFSTNFPDANIINIYYKKHTTKLTIRFASAHLFTIFEFVYFFTHLSTFVGNSNSKHLFTHTRVYLSRHRTQIVNNSH